MPYSETTIATLKKDLERKKKRLAKLNEMAAQEQKEIDALDADIQANDPTPAVIAGDSNQD